MRYSLYAMLFFLTIASSAYAVRDVRSIPQNPWSGVTQIDLSTKSIDVTTLKLEVINGNVQLSWQPLLNHDLESWRTLSAYHIFRGENPSDVKLCGQTVATHWMDIEPSETACFYKVTAVYSPGGTSSSPHRVQRNGGVILNFEDEDLDLQSFSENEDRDPDEWEITNDETLPESENSLCLSGNTWKRMTLDRVDVSDSSVWSIGILSIDGNTESDVQAFGIGDGSNQLFYVFHGRRAIWEHEWQVANQDVHPRGQWHVYHLAVGYDWTIRFGYTPSIDELYFINDNDNNHPASRIYFDELLDVTDQFPPEPIPKVRWRENHQAEAPGVTYDFFASVDNRHGEDLSYFWEFGDGSTSSMTTPTHTYRIDGVYSVSLTVSDNNGLTGSYRETIEIGEMRVQQSATAIFVGDMMMGRRYEARGGIIDQFGPEYVFDRVRPRLTEVDLAVGNLECLLTDEGIRHPLKSIVFRSNPDNVTGLISAGFDIVALANNHVIDYGARGLEETQEVLDAAGIGHTGAGAAEYEALKPVYRTVNGVRIGVLSYCNRTGRDYNDRPFMDASFDRYGYAYFSADNILRSIPPADEDCDMLVVYVHGGWEYEISPTMLGRDDPGTEDDLAFRETIAVDSATRELEHLCIDLGADLVIGSHPHVLQGFEVYSGTFIAHSMGNFALDQNFFETWASAMICTEFDRDQISKVWTEPIFVDNYRPTPATGALGRKILDRLADYSYDLNAIVVPNYETMRGEVVLDPASLHRTEREFRVGAQMRYIDELEIYRSEPIRLNGGGFPAEIIDISPNIPDADLRVSLGRDIILVGNMEQEGAEIWNYNSAYEGPVEDVVHSGTRSSHLTRNQGWRDGITDLTQRIPTSVNDRLTLAGWLRTTNSNDGGLVARYYMYRYNNENRYIVGDEVAEGRLQGDHDWMYVWQNLTVPNNTDFINVRWQLFGANAGENHIWCDDVELIKWDEVNSFDGGLSIDYPNDLYYLQVEGRAPMDSIFVTYRTVTLEIH